MVLRSTSVLALAAVAPAATASPIRDAVAGDPVTLIERRERA